MYLHNRTNVFYPDNGGTLLVIDTKEAKKLDYFVYSYQDHVDVVKQCKKKVIAYSVLSDNLQKRFMSVIGDSDLV
nr:YfmQ family protein [Domibacillus robiginosus]